MGKPNADNCRNSRDLTRLAEANGWAFARQSGSHAVYQRGGSNVIIPMHNGDLCRGMVRRLVQLILAAVMFAAFAACSLYGMVALLVAGAR